MESGDEPGILTTLPVGLVYQAFAAMDRSADATRATRDLPPGIADAVDEMARKWGLTLHALFMNETWF